MKLFTIPALSACLLAGTLAPVSAQLPGAAGAVVEAPARVGEVEIDRVETNLVNTPEFQITGGQNKRFEVRRWLEVEWEYSTKGRMTDKLKFDVTVIVGGKVLPGSVSYVKIADGKHFGVVSIAPATLLSIVGKTVTAQAVQGVIIQASNSQGVTVAQYPKRTTPVPNLPRQEGLVLKKSETPFAPLYWDRYETLETTR